MYKLCVFFLVPLCCLHTISTESPIVEISDGKVLGRKIVTPKGKSFYGFQGIPFADSPIGNLRFADPQAPVKWKETINCTNKKIVCMQSRKYVSEFETEDCLILNVYTPEIGKHANESNFAVMVYFYGGGFYIGNSTFDAYGPDFLIEHDVVVVTINYRIGAFGFLSTQDEVIPGNYGLRDQQFALKWVRNNIRVFGGDPDKVTIFGNSAGSASVGFHILNEESAGLFRAGIMSSGSPLNLWSLQRHPRKVAYLTAQFVNDSTILKSSDELLQFLRSVPALELREASIHMLSLDPFEVDQAMNGYYYAPVYDSYIKNGFFKYPTYESLKNGNCSHAPLMIGVTSEEMLGLIDDLGDLRSIVKKFSSQALVDTDRLKVASKEEKKIIGDFIDKIYLKDNETFEENPHKGLRFLSDQILNIGVIKHAHLASNFSNVFLYQFSYDGDLGHHKNYLEGAGRVGHTEDMHYIWRRNISVNNLNLEAFPENDRLVQKRLLLLYTNFAKYLNPTPKKDPLLQNINWAPVNAREPNDTVYLDINTNLELKSDMKHDTYLKWNEVFAKYATKSYFTF